MMEMMIRNSEFAAVEETITNRADREGILLREGILFSAKRIMFNRITSNNVDWRSLCSHSLRIRRRRHCSLL